MEKVKQESGVTLVILIVSVVVLGILAITAINSGSTGLDTANQQAFISELQMIQAKVNTIYEKRKLSAADKSYYDGIGRNVSGLDQTKLNQALGTTAKEGFKYYTPEDLEKLELNNVTQTVLINYDTREVISYEGIEIADKKYYKLEEMSAYIGRNVQQKTPDTTAEPSFTLEKTKIEEGRWRIIIKNVKYSSERVGLEGIYYKLRSSPNWRMTNKFDIEVTQTGEYEVKVVDTAGKEKIVKIII